MMHIDLDNLTEIGDGGGLLGWLYGKDAGGKFG